MVDNTVDAETTSLEEVIDNHQTQMVGVDAYSSEYIQMMKDLSVLYKLQSEERVSEQKQKEFDLKVKEFQLKEEELEFKREHERNESSYKAKDYTLKEEELEIKREHERNESSYKAKDYTLKEAELEFKLEHERNESYYKAKDYTLKEAEILMKEADLERRGKISPDTVIMVAGNLAGILLILNFEKVGVITSKAMGLLIKLR